MKAEVIPYKKEHAAFIVEQNIRNQESWLQGFSGWKNWIEGWETSGPSYTIMVDGKIVACAGVILLPFRNGEAWTLLSRRFHEYPKACYREIKMGLDRIIITYKLKRVEAMVDVRDGIALNFIEHLKFKVEGKKKNYGPGGEDMYLFARVQ